MPLHLHPPLRDSAHVDGLELERHMTSVITAGGQFWAVCSCTAHSFPLKHGGMAAQWTCPRARAEHVIAQEKTAWDQVMAQHPEIRD